MIEQKDGVITVDVHQAMYALTGDIICDAGFGYQLNAKVLSVCCFVWQGVCVHLNTKLCITFMLCIKIMHREWTNNPS